MQIQYANLKRANSFLYCRQTQTITLYQFVYKMYINILHTTVKMMAGFCVKNNN